jgi:signal transduction histidine kinase
MAEATAFAPAERAAPTEFAASIAALKRDALVRALLDAADISVVVLNQQRQIIVGNSTIVAGLGLDRVELLEGLRPGEALGCVHASETPGGCGTTPSCAVCGAVLAILESQRSHSTVERECLMTVRRGDAIEAFELAVKASQLELGGEIYTVLGLRDISASKRRDALERLFLHDISNTLGALLNWARMIEQPELGVSDQAPRRVLKLAERLQREIEDQRVLLQAENGTLEASRTPVEPERVLATAVALLEGHPVARGRQLEIAGRDATVPIETDESLLTRVLVNMIKNALEATPEGGVVRLWAEERPGRCDLCVWNAGALEPKVALQIFKRSFSTRGGRGRGLGTFSMKLIGERYLRGTVGFTSTEETGTTFFVRLPR